MFTSACRLVVGLGPVRISVSVWLVSGYAHVFILLPVVVVTPPRCSEAGKVTAGLATLPYVFLLLQKSGRYVPVGL